MITVGKSVTFTRQELIEILTPSIMESAKNELTEYLHGKCEALHGLKGLLSGNPDMDDNLIDMWCDLKSDAFFENNPDIDDVMFIHLEKTDNCPAMKMWVASR